MRGTRLQRVPSADLQQLPSDDEERLTARSSSPDEDAFLSPLLTSREGEGHRSILDLYAAAPPWLGDHLSSPLASRAARDATSTRILGKEHHRAVFSHLKHTPWFVDLCDTRYGARPPRMQCVLTRQADFASTHRTGMGIVKCLTRVDIPARGSLFHEGEEAQGMFFLVEGSVALFQLREDDDRVEDACVESSADSHSPDGKSKNSEAWKSLVGAGGGHVHKSYMNKVKVLEDFGEVVGESDLSDYQMRPSSPTSPASPVNVCHRFTAVAETDAKLFHLSKQDYLRNIHANTARLLHEKLEMIERIPLFAKTLSRQALESIAMSISIRKFPAHAVVGAKGDEARLFIILRGAVDMREPPYEDSDDGTIRNEEVVLEPPNTRERVGKLGLKERAVISRLTELSHFGLAEALSQKAHLQYEYRCAVPTDVICIGKEDARRMAYSKWLSETKSDTERIGSWHAEQLQNILHTKSSVEKLWGFQPMVHALPKAKVAPRPSAFRDVTQELWGNPAGESGLPIKGDAVPEPTPKLRRAVMKSIYANPACEDMVSSAEAMLVASMRLNPDAKLRLTVRSPVTKTRKSRPWGAKNVLGTNTMIVPPPIKIPMLDLHKVRQGRRRNRGKGEILSERQEDLERALKQATIHRYRTADGVDKSQHVHPPTAASARSDDESTNDVLPLMPSQKSRRAEWRSLTPVTLSGPTTSRPDLFRLHSADASNDHGEGIDLVMDSLDPNNYHLVWKRTRGDEVFGERGIGAAEAAMMDAEGDYYSDEDLPPKVHEEAEKATELTKQPQKFVGYQPEKPAAEQNLAGSAPLRRSLIAEQLKGVAETVLQFSRGYDEDAYAEKRILKISSVQESEEDSVEDVLKVIFRGLDVKYMALYEGHDGQVSDAIISFDSVETGERALKIAKDVGFDSELLSDKVCKIAFFT